MDKQTDWQGAQLEVSSLYCSVRSTSRLWKHILCGQRYVFEHIYAEWSWWSVCV